jgi:hypothetical protein
MKQLLLLFFALSVSAAPGGFGINPSSKFGLIGFWPVNEGTGTAVRDYSGLANNGTLNSGYTWTNGLLGSCVYFYSGYLKVPNSITLNPGSALSLCLWVFPSSSQNAFGTMASKYEPTLPDYCPKIDLNATGHKIRCYVYGAGPCANQVTCSTDIPTAVWTQIVFVVSQNGSVLYTNSVVCSTSSVTCAYYNDGTGSFSIGCAVGAGDAPGAYFVGAIENASYYNRAISSDEVTRLYNGGYGSQ